MADSEYLERFIDSIHYISRMMKRNARNQVQPDGITKTQWLILRTLHKKPCTIGELAERLEVRSSSMSQMIDRLELSGLVYRQTDILDARSKTVMLSEKGKERMERISQSGIELLSSPFAEFSMEEQEKLVQLLETFRKNLSATFDDSDHAKKK